MFEKMLDLDGRVVGDERKLAMQFLNDAHRVGGSIEEIGIAEGDVLRAGGDLLANIVQHYVALDDAEVALINRHNRAVAAQMFAAAAGLGVGDLTRSFTGCAARNAEAGLRALPNRSIGRDEFEAFERNFGSRF